MSDRANRSGKALSLMIVSLLALSGVLAVAMSAIPARAAPCGQTNPYVNTDWVVSSAETCSGIVFYLDGNLNIQAGGALTIVDGGITFVQDTLHIHSWSIAAGGSMTLHNATVTSSTSTLDPYLKINVAVSGALNLESHSFLKFPGTLNMNSGSTLNMTASTITGFSDNEINGLGTGAWIDDNDDAANITLNGATAFLYWSRIEKIYENSQPGIGAANLVMVGSTLYAYDTYIGIDFSNNNALHNVLTVDTSSHAYLYNVTVDELQSQQTPQYLQLPAMVPTGSGLVDILRFMYAKVTDPYGTPLNLATVWSHVGSQTAQYPDNGNGLVPTARTLWFLGRSSTDWNQTDVLGVRRIPLWTDRITAASLPNAISFGSYQSTGKYLTSYVGTSSVSFPPYPSITAADNNMPVVVGLPVPGLTPDLQVQSVVVSGPTGTSDNQPLNRPFTINATINASGQNPVNNIVVLFFSINIDLNNDGVMDSSVASYQAAGYLIANDTIASIPGGGVGYATATWMVPGSFETGVTVSVIVNPPTGVPSGLSAIPETNLTNNIQRHGISLITWPDLAILDLSDVRFPVTAVANNDVPVDVTVHNLGTAAATSATLGIYEGASLVSNQLTFSLNKGLLANLEVLWHPTSVGNHTLTVRVASATTPTRNVDYNVSNNAVTVVQNVRSQPDLALFASDYSPLNVSQSRPFTIVVKVHNLGQTPVDNTSVAVYLNGNTSVEYGRVDGIAVTTLYNATVSVLGIPVPGSQTLTIIVNPHNTLVEGDLQGTNDPNNRVDIPMTVNAPQGTVIVYNPVAGTNYGPTDTVFVQGVVRDTTAAQNGIPSLPVTVAIVNSNNIVVQFVNTTTTDQGLFQAYVPLNNLPDGTYTLRVSSSQGTIAAATNSIVVKANVPFLNQPVPLIGIPWWLFLIILAAVAAIVIGVTVYFKVYGLGKMVECGECGAFIPEDATTCPKCGVEFEKDMAKCSNCQAWIPVDVKQCPECGVEFATGEVEMADYQEKMRLQYDEVVQKFKEDASRQLGRALSDKEFQEWWRKQPTFLTFEDWLREEEEMRKMGSKPCPVCGTLNSVTATVCHKCGSLMKQEQRPPSGGAGSGGMAPTVRQRSAPPQAPPSDQGPYGGVQGAGAQAGGQRPVIRRPVTPAPVVQKRVIKRPATEGEQAGTQEQTSDQTSGDENQGDEL